MELYNRNTDSTDRLLLNPAFRDRYIRFVNEVGDRVDSMPDSPLKAILFSAASNEFDRELFFSDTIGTDRTREVDAYSFLIHSLIAYLYIPNGVELPNNALNFIDLYRRFEKTNIINDCFILGTYGLVKLSSNRNDSRRCWAIYAKLPNSNKPEYLLWNGEEYGSDAIPVSDADDEYVIEQINDAISQKSRRILSSAMIKRRLFDKAMQSEWEKTKMVEAADMDVTTSEGIKSGRLEIRNFNGIDIGGRAFDITDLPDIMVPVALTSILKRVSDEWLGITLSLRNKLSPVSGLSFLADYDSTANLLKGFFLRFRIFCEHILAGRADTSVFKESIESHLRDFSQDSGVGGKTHNQRLKDLSTPEFEQKIEALEDGSIQFTFKIDRNNLFILLIDPSGKKIWVGKRKQNP